MITVDFPFLVTPTRCLFHFTRIYCTLHYVDFTAVPFDLGALRCYGCYFDDSGYSRLLIRFTRFARFGFCCTLDYTLFAFAVSDSFTSFGCVGLVGLRCAFCPCVCAFCFVWITVPVDCIFARTVLRLRVWTRWLRVTFTRLRVARYRFAVTFHVARYARFVCRFVGLVVTFICRLRVCSCCFVLRGWFGFTRLRLILRLVLDFVGLLFTRCCYFCYAVLVPVVCYVLRCVIVAHYAVPRCLRLIAFVTALYVCVYVRTPLIPPLLFRFAFYALRFFTVTVALHC